MSFFNFCVEPSVASTILKIVIDPKASSNSFLPSKVAFVKRFLWAKVQQSYMHAIIVFGQSTSHTNHIYFGADIQSFLLYLSDFLTSKTSPRWSLIILVLIFGPFEASLVSEVYFQWSKQYR